MHMLYQEEDLSRLKSQVRGRKLVLGCILLLTAVLVGVTLVLDDHKLNRPQWLTVLALALPGCTAIFYAEMMLRPLLAYQRHMTDSLYGRAREVRVAFDHAGENKSVVDGVLFRELLFLGEADKHGDRDRLFYWDAELPLPDFAPGEEITLRYYDRFITGYAR